MEIAIIAHDLKKELMTEFCIAYCGILSKHNLCATSITAKYISDATGLQIERLMAGIHGGKQQIASRISCNEIDVLLYFRDTRPDSQMEEIDHAVGKFSLVPAKPHITIPEYEPAPAGA